MDVNWTVKYITEFLATALLIIIGNGTVANVELKGTKGYKSGWILIAIGYGLAVMMPALMFGNVSGNHINPAFTIALAANGLFPAAQVAPYILAQILGAIFGQLLVVFVNRPYYLQTTDPNNIYATFSTVSAIDNGDPKTRKAALINGFVTEFIGSFILFFGAKALTGNFFGVELKAGLEDAIAQQAAQAAQYGQEIPKEEIQTIVAGQFAQMTNASQTVAHLALGFLVMALVASLGSATGPALNPARDLGPRILHAFLPKSVLGEAKGDSKWWYAWVPVVAPILAGLAAVYLYQFLYQ